jgi:hypothetical protein
VLNSSMAGGMECSGRAGVRGGRAGYRGPGASIELANVHRRGALGEVPVAEEVAAWKSYLRLAIGGPGPSN